MQSVIIPVAVLKNCSQQFRINSYWDGNNLITAWVKRTGEISVSAKTKTLKSVFLVYGYK